MFEKFKKSAENRRRSANLDRIAVALERIADAMEGGNTQRGTSFRSNYRDTSEDGAAVMLQSDEDFAELEHLLKARGGDSVAMDENLEWTELELPK